LLSKGQLVEVDRSEMVAGYLGQTAMKTAEVVASAAGGVLFIDEAYSLAGDQYGQESVDTLVKEMEDRRDDLVLIVAGYPGPMAIFIAQNPGLASRFRTTIEFDDYTDEELVRILKQMAQAADYDLDDGCIERFTGILITTPRGPMFGNARFARNLLEAAIGRHAWRLRDVAEPTVGELRTLIADDFEEAAAETEPPSASPKQPAEGDAATPKEPSSEPG
jgi:SpoVK/Ycf46/Vps4 family AAA+-type ATPase